MSLVNNDSGADERNLRWNRALRKCVIRRIKHINVLMRDSQKREEIDISSHVVPSSGPTKPDECEVCAKILLLFQTPLDEFKFVDLGTKEHILSLSCKAHSRLFAEILMNTGYPDSYQSPIKSVSAFKFRGKRSISFCEKFASGRESGVLPYPFYCSELQLLSLNPRSGLKSTAQTVHPQWIKHGLPRQWKEHCDCRHGTQCRKAPLVAFLTRSQPNWMIDVWSSCLVPGFPAAEYVALSYVWGERRFFTTTKDNIDFLQSPGVLTTLTIPNTIRDALGFTEMLGVRYLWVDSLCIVQDDTNAKHTEMENMGAMYANASLTIIASDGRDAHDGLAGLQGISGPRAYEQDIFDFNHGSKILLQQKPPEGYQCETIWSTRAWTFQELLFSNRRIIFENGSVRWECSKAFWYEDVPQSDEHKVVSSSVLEGRNMLSSKFPDFIGLSRLLGSYNNRDLTYPEDALNAFAGILRALCPAFKSGFLSGLPLAFFNIALLWQPQMYAVRRVARKSISGSTCLPSWSWTGWKCSVGGAMSANEYIKRNSCMIGRPHNEVVIPHVQCTVIET